MDDRKLSQAPVFYTVSEAAAVLRCGTSTLYRAIREDAFPAVKIRTRYVVPATVIDQFVGEATATGGCVDIAQIAAERHAQRPATNGRPPARRVV